MRKILIIAIVLLCVGCVGGPPKESSSLIQQSQRESIIEKGVTDVVRSTETIQPEVTLKTTAKDGTSTEVTVPASTRTEVAATTNVAAASNSSAQGTNELTESIPLYYKVIGLAIGIFLLTIALALPWFLLRRSSRAFNAGFTWVDTSVANLIDRWRDQATRSTDPNEINLIKSFTESLANFRAEAARDD